MFKKFLAMFSGSTVKTQPAELTEIIGAFETQIQELDKRIEFDNEEIQRKTVEQARLEAEKQILEVNVSRGSRIKTKIEDLIA